MPCCWRESHQIAATAFPLIQISNSQTVIASEAKQSIKPHEEEWIASSLALLAMTSRYNSTFSRRGQRPSHA
jgi:hypothetical protein